MLWSFDRREGDLAVLIDENGESLTVPVSSLPPQTEAGTMLYRTEEGFVVDTAATEARRDRAWALQQRLLRRNRENEE